MNVSENICPNCKERNELQAIICVHCGAVLEDPGPKTNKTNLPALISESIGDWSINRAAVPEKGIAVYLEGETNPVYIDSTGDFVIGRQAETTSSAQGPLLDLSLFGGYARGLSRRHAAIQRIESGYQILDLGSVNGTWLNDDRLVPYKHYPLASGSRLRFGGMQLLVLYHPFVETKQKP